MEYLEPLRQKVRDTPLVENISGWNLITSIAVGGLRAVGFSHSGRSLIIATTSDVTIYGRVVQEEHL